MKTVEITVDSLDDMTGEMTRLRRQVTELQATGTKLTLENRTQREELRELISWQYWLEGRIRFLEEEKGNGA